MKKLLFALATLLSLIFIIKWGADMLAFAKGVKEDAARLHYFDLEQELQNGDLIFQVSQSAQSQAIQLASQSKYSHVGIIYKHKNRCYVMEANAKVQLTPLAEFIQQGAQQHYVVKRLKSSQALNDQAKHKMHAFAQSQLGKPYDSYFEWSDNAMYCSELAGKSTNKVLASKSDKLSHYPPSTYPTPKCNDNCKTDMVTTFQSMNPSSLQVPCLNLVYWKSLQKTEKVHHILLSPFYFSHLTPISDYICL